MSEPDSSRLENYYRYYKAFYLPQTNPFVVLLIFFGLVSALHYVMRQSMYETAIANIMRSDKFKREVNDRWDGRQDKDELREEIKNEISIEGGLSRPKIRELFLVRLVLLPVTISKWIYFNLRWLYLFKIRGL